MCSNIHVQTEKDQCLLILEMRPIVEEYSLVLEKNFFQWIVFLVYATYFVVILNKHTDSHMYHINVSN